MKTMPEFEHTIRMPDGEELPVRIAVENRMVIVRPSEGENPYLMQMSPVMEQARQAVAERAGHTNQTNVVVAPTWAAPPSQFLGLIAQNNVGAGMLHLKKGARYVVIIWQGAASKNVDIQPINPGATLDDIREDWQRQGLAILEMIEIEGAGQTIIVPSS